MLKIRRISTAAMAGLFVLSAIPAGVRADPGRKNVVFLAARDGTDAKRLVGRLEQAVRDDVILMESYAIVARDSRGRLEVKEEWEKAPAKALPPGFGAGLTAVAAVFGALAGLLVERGEDAGIGFIAGSAASRPTKPEWPDAPSVWPEEFDEEVMRLARGIQPGQTALIAVIDERVPTTGTVVDFDKLRARQELDREIPVLKTAR
jgi:hypothetical protein